MMLRAEPPPAPVSLAVVSEVAEGSARADESPPVVSEAPRDSARHLVDRALGADVVDAQEIASEEAELDALLFGDSCPGVEPTDATLAGSDPALERDSDPGLDARPDLDSDPGLFVRPSDAQAAVKAKDALPEGLLETLARLARDTSPGTLEAPDTLPG